MRTSALALIAAAVLAGGSFGLLAGCSETPADAPAVSPPDRYAASVIPGTG